MSTSNVFVEIVRNAFGPRVEVSIPQASLGAFFTHTQKVKFDGGIFRDIQIKKLL